MYQSEGYIFLYIMFQQSRVGCLSLVSLVCYAQSGPMFQSIHMLEINTVCYEMQRRYFFFLPDLVEAQEYRCYIMLGKRFIKWLAMLFHCHSHSLFISLIEVVITIRISYNRWVLANNLLHQRFLVDKLMVSLRRFYDCHNYLVNRYGDPCGILKLT
jgi:hypothetical protein